MNNKKNKLYNAKLNMKHMITKRNLNNNKENYNKN